MSKDVEAKNKDFERSERFLKLAVNRTRMIIKGYNNLMSCANRKNYSYTPKQVEAIFDALKEAHASCKDTFSDNPVEGKKEFDL